MKLPKANLRDISVEKVAPDIISALFLVSLVRKLYGNRKAIKQLQRLILENKPVDSEKFIRANFKLGIPLVIITKTEHMKGRFLPALRKLGLPKEKVNQVVQRALEIFPLVIRGNGFASLISDEKGEKKFAFVAVPPKANPFLMKHEMGHILYRLKEGRPMIKGFKITAEPFLQSLSFLSRIYSKKSKYGIEKEEGIAWDIVGVPKDNPLRQASQKTYETSMGFAASGLKWVLASAFSPYIIQLAGKLKSVIKKNVLKEDALEEKTKSKFVRLKDNRKPLTPEERTEVMQKKAIWHNGPGGKPAPAVWKSINPTTGEVTYVTNTHRAYQARPTLNGAISIYHRFIKSTA